MFESSKYVPNGYVEYNELVSNTLKTATNCKIDMTISNFETINDALKHLQGLYTLELLNVTKIPNNVYTLKNLEHLCINGCGTIVEVSDEIQNLECLEEFYMFGCGLVEIPNAVFKSKSIEKLSFFNNKISQISEEILNMPNLYQLNCSNNLIEFVPEILKNKIKIFTSY